MSTRPSLGRVLINQEARRGAFDVRLSPNSGAKADTVGGPRRAISGMRDYDFPSPAAWQLRGLFR